MDETKTSYEIDHATTDTKMIQGPGDAMPVSASVRVPRSYFVQAFRNKNNKDPNDTDLDAFSQDELTQIRKDVKACTGIMLDDNVIVGVYDDAMPAPTPVTATAGAHPSLKPTP